MRKLNAFQAEFLMKHHHEIRHLVLRFTNSMNSDRLIDVLLYRQLGLESYNEMARIFGCLRLERTDKNYLDAAAWKQQKYFAGQLFNPGNDKEPK